MKTSSTSLQGKSPDADPILYEAHNLMLKGGTGIATYARSLLQASVKLGFEAHGLIGVQRGLKRNGSRVNEVLAFDAIPDNYVEPLLETIGRYARYPFNALGGIRPVELTRSGLVIEALTDALKSFHRTFATTQLVDVAIAHFKIYGRLAEVKMPCRYALFHATHPTPLFVKGCPNIYTIHDLVPLRLPHATLEDKKYFYGMLQSLAQKADHIVTVSEHSRRDIIEYLGIDEARVTNTYQPVDLPQQQLDRNVDDVAEDLKRLFGLEFGEYFLFYGAIEPKKNVSRLIDAYSGSGTTRPLVIAGAGGWQNRLDLRKIRDERFVSFQIDGNAIRRQRQIRRVGYVPKDQLVSLIRGARGILFPSIYEGFGLPVVEAMQIGTPVITSNIASLPEVAGDAALLVDPYDTVALSNAIAAIDNDQSLRSELRAKGQIQAQRFSTSAYEERLSHLYRSLLHGK